ncbi:MAG: 30S ribosome-binding factor RbfA [Armatimonadota bacterium]|nr:30S ribosome-binding factor RbfA [Armatimonadota bacterium]MDR7518203.1 30S ribosome-binding factor RbfA [Armatimonadota bacterium]
MPPTRAERLAEVIRTEASEIIQRELKDPRIGFVSITDVVVSTDLRHAKIFVSVLGDEAAKQRSMEGLERARGHIRSALGARLQVRFVPEILFRLDESIERGARVVSLMREVGEGSGGGAGGHRPDATG